MTGTVTLVGAGAGNSGLMTLAGLRALKASDCVVYDRLLGDGVLELIPETAEKINAGKADNHHLLPQYKINEILIAKAKEGKNVVRLKGGDCFIFGRGGEEAEALSAAGVPFRVIPGVSSAAAAPAYGGIPVTHRDAASSLHIITGHKKDGSLDIDFESYAKIGGTLVFLMGVKNLASIARGLVCGGMREDTPCAVIENGGSWRQRKAVSDLKNIAEAAKDLKSPAIIVVGRVCEYSGTLDWFSALPLKGKKIVVSRPRERAEELCRRLRELGAGVEIIPCISFEAVECDFSDDLEWCDSVAFTSVTGVRFAFDSLLNKGLDSRAFGGRAVCAVGRKTACELLKYGIAADIVPKEENGRALAEEIFKRGFKKALILRAEKGADSLTEYFAAEGVKYRDRPVYKTVVKEAEYKGGADFVIFASPSEVRGFAYAKKDFTGVCIGRTTAAEAERLGIRHITAESPDDDGFINALLKELKK